MRGKFLQPLNSLYLLEGGVGDQLEVSVVYYIKNN